jgi:hypothetical protein
MQYLRVPGKSLDGLSGRNIPEEDGSIPSCTAKLGIIMNPVRLPVSKRGGVVDLLHIWK